MQLMCDALTILRAYATAEDKVSVTPLASFERWSKVCREPLMWLGLADPCETQAAEADDDSAGLAEAFAALAERWGDAEWTAAELADAMSESSMGSPTARAAALAAGLEAGGLRDPERARYWLREQRDRVAGGRKLVQARVVHGSARWAVRAS